MAIEARIVKGRVAYFVGFVGIFAMLQKQPGTSFMSILTCYVKRCVTGILLTHWVLVASVLPRNRFCYQPIICICTLARSFLHCTTIFIACTDIGAMLE